MKNVIKICYAFNLVTISYTYCLQSGTKLLDFVMVQKTFTKKSKVIINHWCDQYFNDHLVTLPELD